MKLVNKLLAAAAALVVSSVSYAQPTSDVQIVLKDAFPNGFYVESVTPATVDIAPLGNANLNPTLKLTVGTRYKISYVNFALHPFQIVSKGATPPQDVVLLSQGPTIGTLETDPAIGWLDAPPDIYFTLSDSLVQALVNPGYRCEPHPDVMRGSIEIVQAPPVTGPNLVPSFSNIQQICKEKKAGLKCKVKVAVAVANTGTEKSLPTDIQVVLSTDELVDVNDTTLRTMRAPAIKPGKTKVKKAVISLDTGTSVTGQNIIAVVNTSNAVPETNKDDNTVIVRID